MQALYVRLQRELLDVAICTGDPPEEGGRYLLEGAGRGIYHPWAVGGMAVLILWLVGMLVGIVVEASLGNL